MVVDFGCGGGLNTLFAASKGFSSLGVDISRRALDLSRSRALESGSSAKFDLLDLTNPWALNFHYQNLTNFADAAVDVQTWHAIRGGIAGSPEEKAYVANVATILKPGGHMLVVCGNNTDPTNLHGERGPPVVSEDDIISAFCNGHEPLFELISLETAAFDPTPVFGDSPPLCWNVVLRRTLETPRGLADLPTDEQDQQNFHTDVAGYPRPPAGVSGYVR